MVATSPYQNTITMGPLAAAVANGIAQSQAGTGSVPLTLNGSLVSAGVANLGTTARRVIVTSAGNDSGITFTIVGTDRYGRSQTEILTGANTAAAQTYRDFLTVTSITPSGSTAANVTAGTNGVASSTPIILDGIINPQGYAAALTVPSGTTASLEVAPDDLGPDYNLNLNVPNWMGANGGTNFTGIIATSAIGDLGQGFNMVRLTILSGTGTVTAWIKTPLKAGGF